MDSNTRSTSTSGRSVEKKKPPKILMIQNDQDLSDHWMSLFNMLGYEHRFHLRPASALEDQEWIRIADVTICDYDMPDMSSEEFVNRIRAINSDMPVIVLTGSRHETAADLVRQIERCALLSKPVDIRSLESKIQELVEA